MAIATAVVFTLGLAACGGTVQESSSGAPASAAAASPTSKPLVGFVGYDRVRVEDEEDLTGDEVLLIILKVRSTLGVPGSTRWEWVTPTPSATDETDEGSEAGIPDSAGDAWFTGDMAVQPLDIDQVMDDTNILKADVMVTVAFVLEEDLGLPLFDVALLNSLADPVVRQVAGIVESARIPVTMTTWQDSTEAEKAFAEVGKKLKQINPPELGWGIFSSLFTRFMSSGFDPNDVVGVVGTAFVPVSQETFDTLAFLKVTPKQLGLLGPNEGDGNQAWTNYYAWNENNIDMKIGKGSISGELWYGLISPTWVDDWMKVGSEFPWQGSVAYWFKVTAAMRDAPA